MRKRHNVIFTLIDNNASEYIAVSEQEEFIQRYIQQYFVYLKDRVSLAKVEGNEALKIYKHYQGYFIQPIGNLFLTEYELDYYSGFFHDNYFKITQMISTIPFVRNLLLLDDTESETMNRLFMKMYTKCNTMENFIESIDVEKFVNYVSVDPTKIFETNNYNREMNDRLIYVMQK